MTEDGMPRLPEPKWTKRHGMWVRAEWQPGPAMPAQDALYRKWLWTDGEKVMLEDTPEESNESTLHCLQQEHSQ